MAREPIKSDTVFSRRLLNVVTIIDRFHQEAARKGDQAFAEALKNCALIISGGDMQCPLGALVVSETVRTGKFPLSALTPQAPREKQPSPSMGAPPTRATTVAHSPVKALEWQATFTKLWKLLEEEARRTGEKDLLSALQECEEVTAYHACPVRELIAQSLGQGRKP